MSSSISFVLGAIFPMPWPQMEDNWTAPHLILFSQQREAVQHRRQEASKVLYFYYHFYYILNVCDK
jgi:hypothetical protein